MAKAHPTIIQGGMGVAVSSWRLARGVSQTGQLGVVSGTGLDGVLARVLQDGDPGGHARRALAHFPSPAMAQRVLDAYFVEGGRPAGRPYRPHPTLTIAPRRPAIELALAGNFVEVWLAKECHDGLVGVNFLEKIQTATLSAVLGAMLAEVDYVLMGAGIPKEAPSPRPGRPALRRETPTPPPSCPHLSHAPRRRVAPSFRSAISGSGWTRGHPGYDAGADAHRAHWDGPSTRM